MFWFFLIVGRHAEAELVLVIDSAGGEPGADGGDPGSGSDPGPAADHPPGRDGHPRPGPAADAGGHAQRPAAALPLHPHASILLGSGSSPGTQHPRQTRSDRTDPRPHPSADHSLGHRSDPHGRPPPHPDTCHSPGCGAHALPGARPGSSACAGPRLRPLNGACSASDVRPGGRPASGPAPGVCRPSAPGG